MLAPRLLLSLLLLLAPPATYGGWQAPYLGKCVAANQGVVEGWLSTSNPAAPCSYVLDNPIRMCAVTVDGTFQPQRCIFHFEAPPGGSFTLANVGGSCGIVGGDGTPWWQCSTWKDDDRGDSEITYYGKRWGTLDASWSHSDATQRCQTSLLTVPWPLIVAPDTPEVDLRISLSSNPPPQLQYLLESGF
eukprot:NODE_1615_length_897_cov_41.567217_g1260_i0.p1 GENE.NODE_1615_length_897_cov_41.567217_g1260_i0~~NODE_1615_length_897_cov_41.567217_g1260_i0.p1  ORF type:complete len:207 (-),score=50.09 NODE_1615_length_897_cov_41.567217_g1260_i0:277-843(-)